MRLCPAAPAGGEDGKQTAVFDKEEVPCAGRRAGGIPRLDGSQCRIGYASRARAAEFVFLHFLAYQPHDKLGICSHGSVEGRFFCPRISCKCLLCAASRRPVAMRACTARALNSLIECSIEAGILLSGNGALRAVGLSLTASRDACVH